MPLFDSAYIFAAALAMSGASFDAPVDPLDVTCLALNVYHEARGEGLTGQIAVAHVTLNRAADPRYPDRLCEVVTQRSRNVCQFSWYCQRDSWKAYDSQSFRRALRVAVEALKGVRNDPTKGATHFVATSIRMPGWTRRMRQTAHIGSHRFFRG
jgi:spore germination cell wall hydrolase CwlJ-like protein